MVYSSQWHRKTAVLKVRTDIIASIAASPTERAVIPVIMYVKIFKTGIIFFIGDIKICSMSSWPIIFNIKVSSWACELWPDLIFFCMKVSSMIQTLSGAHIKGKMLHFLINSVTNLCLSDNVVSFAPFNLSTYFSLYFRWNQVTF